MSLAEFFAEMKPMLLGRSTASTVEERLGPSPSGTTNLDFYRVLIDRNYHKFLRDIFPSVHNVARRLRPELWSELVREFGREQPPAHWDANMFGEGFSDYLVARRQRDDSIPPLLEELADFHWVQHRASVATDDFDGDGFEHRLFVRQYTYEVPQFVSAVAQDPDAPLPATKPTAIFLFRSFHTLNARVLYATPISFAVLAHRQGVEPPPQLRVFSSDDLDAAERDLIKRGVLADGPTEKKDQ